MVFMPETFLMLSADIKSSKKVLKSTSLIINLILLHGFNNNGTFFQILNVSVNVS